MSAPQPELQPQPEPAPGAPTQPWAYAAAPVRWVETVPLEYHQLLRGVRRYRWWKPLVGTLLGVIYYFALSIPVGMLLLFLHFGLSGEPMTIEAVEAFAAPDTQQPMTVFLALFSIALMIPAVWLAMLSVGLTPIGRGWSVALRIRWGFLGRTLLPALVAFVLLYAVGTALEIALSGVTGDASEQGELATPAGFRVEAALWSMLWVLLLVPLQATAEELVFRGAFMQVLGAWLGGVRGVGAAAAFLRGPWLPILIPSVAFGFSHIYDVWGWMHVVAMAVTAGWLTWRTGGLEAAMSLHVVNNVVVFAILSSGLTGETGQTVDGGGSLGGLIGSVAAFAFFAWWVDRIFRKRGGPRTRIDLVEDRGALPGPAVAPGAPAA